jgi:transposase
LTFDNGREFSWHEKLAENLDCNTYFAKPYQKEQVKAISCDMSPAFIKGVRDNLPKAKITFDCKT